MVEYRGGVIAHTLHIAQASCVYRCGSDRKLVYVSMGWHSPHTAEGFAAETLESSLSLDPDVCHLGIQR
jgi:hypothetical protein